MNWSTAASVGTVGASVAIVLTALIYYRQLGAMTKARELSSILAILERTDNLALRRARYLIYEHSNSLWALLSDEPDYASIRKTLDAKIRELSGGEVRLHDVDLSLNALNNVCFLINSKHAPAEIVTNLLRNSLLHSWDAFEPYVRWRRTRRISNAPPSSYGQHLQSVVGTMRNRA